MCVLIGRREKEELAMRCEHLSKVRKGGREKHSLVEWSSGTTRINKLWPRRETMPGYVAARNTVERRDTLYTKCVFVIISCPHPLDQVLLDELGRELQQTKGDLGEERKTNRDLRSVVNV